MATQTEMIAKLLKSLGMDQSTNFLPLANEENLQLLRRLEQKGAKVLKLQEEQEDQQSHCENLRAHEISILSRNDVCQKAIQAKASVLLSETSMLKLTENGSRYYNRECARLKKQLEEQRKANRTSIVKLKRREAVIHEISKTIKFEMEVLEKFKKGNNENDGELEIMRKFMKLDHELVKECELKEKKLVRMLEASKRHFDTVLVETKLCERELSRVTADFRRIHKERNDAVDRWKETLDYIKKKDSGINAAAEEYRLHRQMSRLIDAVFQKKQAMLESCAANIKAIDYKLQATDLTISEYQLALNSNKQYVKDMFVRTADARFAISRGTEAIQELGTKKARIAKERQAALNKKDKLEAEVELLRTRHAQSRLVKLSAEESLEEVYNMIEVEQEKVTAAKNQLEVIRGYYMTKLNDANQLKRDSTVVDHRIAESRNWMKNILRQIKELTYQLERKKQTLFKLELEKFRYTNQIADLKHSSNISPSDDDLRMSIYNKKYVENCRQERIHLQNLKLMISTQVGSLETMRMKIINSISVQEANRASLSNQARLYTGDNKRLVYQGAQLVVQHQNLFVDEQMMKITLSRLKKQVKQRNHHNLNLASKRALMQAVAKERRSEVSQHLKLLQQRKRDLANYASKLILQKREVLKDTEIKKKGYDITTSSLITQQDREAGIQSEASIILKHAQDRELINREMECWRNRVESAEAETVGLKNNLDLMNALNSTLKQTVAPVEINEKYEKRLKELKKIGHLTMMRKRRAIRYQHDLERKLEEMGFKISQIELTGFSTASSLEGKNRELYLIEVELANQKTKIQRAKKVFDLGSKALRKLSATERKLIETDLKVRCVFEKFKFSLQHLDRAIGIHPKLKNAVQPILNETTELQHIGKDLETFGHCAHPSSLVRARRKPGVILMHRAVQIAGSSVQFFSPTTPSSQQSQDSLRSTSGKSTPVGVHPSNTVPRHIYSRKQTTAGSHTHLFKTAQAESHPGKPTTVEKLLKALHSAKSVAATQVKKEEYEKLKEAYQFHKEIKDNEAAVEHAFEVGMGWVSSEPN